MSHLLHHQRDRRRFVAYGFIKLVRGRVSDVHPMMHLTAMAFVVYVAAPLVERLLRA